MLITASIALIPAAAAAAVTVNIRQVGSDVVSTSSGSLNLTGLTIYESSSAIAESINPSLAFAELGDGAQSVAAYVGLLSYPTNFGPGNSFIGSSSVTGDAFAVYGAYGLVVLPNAYISGNPIAASATWLKQSIASLGLTPGTYTFTAPADTLVVNIEAVPAVAEPASWAMMLLGFGSIGCAMRKRRRPAPALVCNEAA